MSQVFISYRRSDSAYVTDRLYDSLLKRFGEDAIFKDVDSIALGEDFSRKINESLEEACALIVVIGSNWLTASNDTGTRRLDLPDDYVCMEIKAAIDSGISIIPVLIDGASMPAPHDLPPAIRGLSLRNAAPLRPDPDFNSDLRTISDRIAELLYRPSSQPTESAFSAFISLTKIKDYFRTRAAIKNGDPLFERDAKSIRVAGQLGPWAFNLYETVLAIMPSIFLAWTLDLFSPQAPPNYTFAPNASELDQRLFIESIRVHEKLQVVVSAMLPPVTLIWLAWVASWAALRSGDSTPAKRRETKHAFLYYDGSFGLIPQMLLSLSISVAVILAQRSIAEPIYWTATGAVLLVGLGWNYHVFWLKVPKMLFISNGYSLETPRISKIGWAMIIGAVCCISFGFVVLTFAERVDILLSLLLFAIAGLMLAIFLGSGRKRIENPAPWGKYKAAMILVGGLGSWAIIIGLSALAVLLAQAIARITVQLA